MGSEVQNCLCEPVRDSSQSKSDSRVSLANFDENQLVLYGPCGARGEVSYWGWIGYG